MKTIILIAVLIFVTGCTTVRYNGTQSIVKEVDYPEVGTIVTVFVGDHMIQKGTISEESVLVVRNNIDGASYDILAGKYPQIGFDDQQDFYSSVGVVQGMLSDPFKALSLKRSDDAKLCVITIFGASACYDGEYERATQLSEKGNSFQQTLIYSGRVGDKINISYREFSNNNARPAFNNDVEYDLSSSNTIGYKGSVIEVLNANNSSITYKLVKNFP